MNTQHPSLLRRLAGVLLGLFVLWQLFFLISANFLRMAEDARPHLKESELARQLAPDWLEEKGTTYAVAAWARRADRRWSELTGQPQSWSLFAPNVAEHVPFPVVELRWDEGPGAPAPQILDSDNEPPDRGRFFRFGRFRLRRFEGNVVVALAPRDRPREAAVQDWRGKVESHLREEGDCVHAYLRRRLAEFELAHPELPPPRQVILSVRVYRVPPPPGPEPWDWQLVLDAQPVARWRPGAEPGLGYAPLEMYDPVRERFEPLPKYR